MSANRGTLTLIGKGLLGVGAAGAGCLAYAGLYEVNAFRLRRVTVLALPMGARPIRVLHVSDLHMTPYAKARQRWLSTLGALEPDLVLAFSDLQAAIVADLVRAGVAVHVFNQRDIKGILAMIRTLGALVGAAERAELLAAGFEARLAEVAATPRPAPKPKVYFEEWDDPLISGIGWVSELIEIAGGEDLLPQLRLQQSAKDRIISPDTVRDAAPDVILASWCGKKVVPDRIRKRPGWETIPAVRDNRIVEIKSPIILQPGPAALTDGLDAIVRALWGT